MRTGTTLEPPVRTEIAKALHDRSLRRNDAALLGFGQHAAPVADPSFVEEPSRGIRPLLETVLPLLRGEDLESAKPNRLLKARLVLGQS